MCELSLPGDPSPVQAPTGFPADRLHCALPRLLLVELLRSGALSAQQLTCLDPCSEQLLRRCILDSCCAPDAAEAGCS